MKLFYNVLVVFLVVALAGCSKNPGPASSDGASTSTSQSTHSPKKNRATAREVSPSSKTGTVDTVKIRKDPKGGWFGPKLKDVYFEHQDTPVIFCDSGPSVRTGKTVTIFYEEEESKPESSACFKTIAVVEGQGIWVKGKPLTMQEFESVRDQQESFVPVAIALKYASNFTSGWRRPKPVGDPCPDTSGAPDAVRQRYKGAKCSVVLILANDYIFFVNWTVVGRNDQMGSDTAQDIVSRIRKEYGDRYIVTK